MSIMDKNFFELIYFISDIENITTSKSLTLAEGCEEDNVSAFEIRNPARGGVRMTKLRDHLNFFDSGRTPKGR